MARSLAAGIAALVCALTGCGGSGHAASSAAVRSADASLIDSFLLDHVELGRLLGHQFTVVDEHRKPDNARSKAVPASCATAIDSGGSALYTSPWAAYRDRSFDENVTAQSREQHIALGEVTAEEEIYQYAEPGQADDAQRAMSDAVRRCDRQTVVVLTAQNGESPWEIVGDQTTSDSTAWRATKPGTAWTCAGRSERREAFVVQIWACSYEDSPAKAAKIMDRILEDRA